MAKKSSTTGRKPGLKDDTKKSSGTSELAKPKFETGLSPYPRYPGNRAVLALLLLNESLSYLDEVGLGIRLQQHLESDE